MWPDGFSRVVMKYTRSGFKVINGKYETTATGSLFEHTLVEMQLVFILFAVIAKQLRDSCSIESSS